ncbi:hypothetical protein, partial [Mesorhizobium sp.]|uniref:hypothetical protein n=1 Tax=Mesorhizobium sp. TaxID=1871066 RepID=UPI0032AEFD8D
AGRGCFSGGGMRHFVFQMKGRLAGPVRHDAAVSYHGARQWSSPWRKPLKSGFRAHVFWL